MHTTVHKLPPIKTSPAGNASQTRTSGDSFSFADRRPVAAVQLRIREMAESFATGQPPVQRKPNETGLPDHLKSGIENLSGYSMDDVKVHYNSDKPQQLNAHACAQGTDIHLASGQEKHLPHEAWHVVQQKQGRVKANAQLKGIGLNDDAALEKEADVMGSKALNGTAPAARLRANTPAGRPIAQLKQKNAASYIKANNLGIGSSQKEVKDYIENTGNPKVHRQNLLRAWNKGMTVIWFIDTPEDLVPSKSAMDIVDDLEDWDSEAEDDLDLDKAIENKKTDDYSLMRSDNSVVDNVPHLPFLDAIRLGRQIVKREEYHRLPIATSLGDFRFELNNPGTKDIYTTPIEKQEDKGGKKKKEKKKKVYKRTGTSSEFNYTNLVRKLRRQHKDAGEIGMQLMKFFLKGGGKVELDESMAETIGAMGADFMKGSLGARFYLRKAMHRIAKKQKAKEKVDFGTIFSGQKPLYTPALTGGRGMVVDRTRYEREVNRLLGVNNCLINAIAQAALGRNANLGELMRIREQHGSFGDMMVADPGTINIIRQELGINNSIRVHYRLDNGKPNEDFDSVGMRLDIYHTGDLHFVHVCPDPVMYYD